jgi:CheY-like chemotaxis protein
MWIVAGRVRSGRLEVSLGFEAAVVASGQEALQLIENDRQYSALVKDINLQDD